MYLRELKTDSKRHLYTPTRGAVPERVEGKQPRCPSIDAWLSKMWGSHTEECDSALEEHPTHAPTWMNSEADITSTVKEARQAGGHPATPRV